MIIHPGEHVREFLDEFEITPYRLAKDIDVPMSRIDRIIKRKRGISADTALRLGKYFGTTTQFWQNLQSNYELESIDPSIADRIKTLTA